jgi:hypothetical protein
LIEKLVNIMCLLDNICHFSDLVPFPWLSTQSVNVHAYFCQSSSSLSCHFWLQIIFNWMIRSWYVRIPKKSNRITFSCAHRVTIIYRVDFTYVTFIFVININTLVTSLFLLDEKLVFFCNKCQKMIDRITNSLSRSIISLLIQSPMAEFLL